MKTRILLSALLSLASLPAMAQVTIDGSGLVEPGHYVVQATDSTPPSSLSVGSTGQQTWDFSNLKAQGIDTIKFVNPKWTSFSSQFPNATVAFDMQGQFTFMRNTSSGLYFEGFAGQFDSFNVTAKYKPEELFFKWPMHYNDTFSSKSKVSFVFPSGGGGISPDSIRIRETIMNTSKADAYGTLTTPLGSYSALRVSKQDVTIDSLDGYFSTLGQWVPMTSSTDTSRYYQWLSNDTRVGFTLAEANLDSTGKISDISWLKVLPTVSSVAQVNAPSNIELYPNPAQGQLNISTPGQNARFIETYDINGRLISRNTTSGELSHVDLNTYKAGLYFCRVLSADNALLYQGKFQVLGN